jgi:hypothetical protein
MKRLSVLVFILAFILILAACGKESNDGEGVKTPESPSPSASTSAPPPSTDGNTQSDVTQEPDRTEDTNDNSGDVDIFLRVVGYSWTTGNTQVTIGGGDKGAEVFNKGLVAGLYAVDASHDKYLIHMTMTTERVRLFEGGISWPVRGTPGENGFLYEVRLFNTDDINDLNDNTFVKRSETMTVQGKP